MVLSAFPANGKIAPVEHYSRLPSIYDAAISPDGNWLAMIVDNNGKYILRVFNLGDPSDKKIRAAPFTRMKRALKKSKTEATFMKFEDEDHYFINYENRTKLLKGLDKFLRENLGESAAAP